MVSEDDVVIVVRIIIFPPISDLCLAQACAIVLYLYLGKRCRLDGVALLLSKEYSH